MASIETRRMTEALSGRMPTTSVRRAISRLKRSSGVRLTPSATPVAAGCAAVAQRRPSKNGRHGIAGAMGRLSTTGPATGRRAARRRRVWAVAHELMQAEVSELVGAEHGERSQDRAPHRNG
jgi:hypothetical protein